MAAGKEESGWEMPSFVGIRPRFARQIVAVNANLPRNPSRGMCPRIFIHPHLENICLVGQTDSPPTNIDRKLSNAVSLVTIRCFSFRNGGGDMERRGDSAIIDASYTTVCALKMCDN